MDLPLIAISFGLGFLTALSAVGLLAWADTSTGGEWSDGN